MTRVTRSSQNPDQSLRNYRTSAVLLVFGIVATRSVEGQNFIGLGTLPEHVASEALAISGNGAFVVGRSFTSDGSVDAFRWAAGEISGLGSGAAIDVSNDGSMIAGCEACDTNSNGGSPFVWTTNLEKTALGDSDESFVGGISGDGSVIVGQNAGRAFRWTEETGIQDIGFLSGGFAGGGIFTRATDVSSDGSTIVGQGRKAHGTEAIRWTENDLGVGLGDLPGGIFESQATSISGDGFVVVGSSASSSGVEAFRWSSTSGMMGLGDLPGGQFFSEAFGVSHNGTIVVGTAATGFGDEDRRAFIWDADHGMRSLQDVLVDAGADLTGWELTEATGISADGSAIVGNGSLGAWLATLDSDVTPVVVQPGDANLDGEFNSSDLVTAFFGAKFETDIAANWMDGDWNGAPTDSYTLSDRVGPPGDGFFNSKDLIAAFQTGLYEAGPYNVALSTANVPEPVSIKIVVLFLIILVVRDRTTKPLKQTIAAC